MGFLSGLGRLLQGKPVFQAPQAGSEKSPWQPSFSAETPTDERGRKIIPELRVEHCHTHLSGDDTMVTVWLTNTSDGDIDLDKVVILDVKRELDRRLGPGQAHEVVLYKGPVPMSDAARKAQLYYRLVSSDDYFRADFLVEYQRQSDGSCPIEGLRPEYPIRDV